MQQNLRPNIKVRTALTQIYGIGSFTANQVCDQLGLRSSLLVKHLNRAQLDQLARVINRFHVTGQELERVIQQDISRFVRISIYKGFRFTQGLPVRGQRTRTNGRTRRGGKKTVAGKNK